MQAVYRQPECLTLQDQNLSQNFQKWRRQVEVYLAASGALKKSKQTQRAVILHCAGPDIIEIEPNFVYGNGEDREDQAYFSQK